MCPHVRPRLPSGFSRTAPSRILVLVREERTRTGTIRYIGESASSSSIGLCHFFKDAEKTHAHDETTRARLTRQCGTRVPSGAGDCPARAARSSPLSGVRLGVAGRGACRAVGPPGPVRSTRPARSISEREVGDRSRPSERETTKRVGACARRGGVPVAEASPRPRNTDFPVLYGEGPRAVRHEKACTHTRARRAGHGPPR